MSNTNTNPAWAARCCCYNNHNSSSGRCNARNVTDPTRHEADQFAACESCRANCPCGKGTRSNQVVAGKAYAIFSRRDLTQMLRFLDDQGCLESVDVVVVESELVRFEGENETLQFCSDYTLRTPHQSEGTPRYAVPYLAKYDAKS